MAKSVSKPGDSLLVDILGESRTPFDSAYVLGEEINAGSFGVVYKTHHISNDETLAVKVIQRDCQDAEDEALHETEILRQLRHIPHVIQLIDFFMDKELIFIVQELAQGGDVFDRLAKRNVYTENDARELAKNLLTTIDCIHKHRIVHRDLKPENLLLKNEDNDYGILVCDFGLAKQLPDNEDSGLLTFRGTPCYTAPEIIEGQEYIEKVDMWSIGCILFMLLGGYLPFGEEGDTDLYHRISDADYDFENEAWDCVSGSAKKLVSNLFQLDPKKRLSASEALNSPWLTTKGSQSQDIHLEKTLIGIKKICVRRKFKAACHVVKLSNRAMSFVESSRSLCSNGQTSKKASLAAFLSEAANREDDSETESTLSCADAIDIVNAEFDHDYQTAHILQ